MPHFDKGRLARKAAVMETWQGCNRRRSHRRRRSSGRNRQPSLEPLKCGVVIVVRSLRRTSDGRRCRKRMTSQSVNTSDNASAKKPMAAMTLVTSQHFKTEA